MKKLTCFIIVVVFIFSMCLSASAQTLDSSVWGIKFNLSDNWKPVYNNPAAIEYSHNTTDEDIEIIYSNSSVSSTRAAQDSFDKYYNVMFSNNYLAESLTDANNASISVTENYQKRRYETYNGVEYYRCEKLYLAKSDKHLDTYFYKTTFGVAMNGKVFMITYDCSGSTAPNFADITAMLNSMTYTGGVGNVIGYALKTDIVATINGHAIPSFNVDGYTYIVAEDLKYYGFGVNYDNSTRSLAVNRDYSQTWVSKDYVKPYVAPDQVGAKEHSILSTDIKTYLNNNYIPSYNINGQTIIRFDELKACGGVSYDNNRREISLSLVGIN